MSTQQPAHSVVDFAATTVIGLGLDCPGFDFSGVGPLWDRFAPRMTELPAGGRVFGVGLPRADGCYYIAGVEVPEGTALPEGMEQTVIPAAQYFRVHFHDRPDAMGAMFGRIFSELIPAAGLRHAPGPVCLEEYGPGWHEEEAGKFNIHLYVQLA
jgi:predicted transcriptional regulator YdeE